MLLENEEPILKWTLVDLRPDFKLLSEFHSISQVDFT